MNSRCCNVRERCGGVEGEYLWVGFHELGSFSMSEYQLVLETSELTAATHFSDFIISCGGLRDGGSG